MIQNSVMPDPEQTEEMHAENGDWIGRLVWRDCNQADDAYEVMRVAWLYHQHGELLKSGYGERLPFRVLEWIHFIEKYQNQGRGTSRINRFIEDAKKDGIQRIYLKAEYPVLTKGWEIIRDRHERYYERFGFICFREKEEIRPLMLLNL